MKEIAVFGLGKFGQSVAEAYTREGGNVLAIDNDIEKIQEISEKVTYAVKADITEVGSLKGIGLSNVDVSVVAIAENIEAAIMAVILSKEAGIPTVIAKAQNEIFGNVLLKVGADKIIYPEKEMGVKVARNIARSNFLDIADLSDEFSIVEVKIPEDWVGKTIMSLNVRKKYGFNIIAKKSNNKMDITINPEEILKEEDVLVVLGENTKLARCFKTI